jgi:hypothetical protein
MILILAGAAVAPGDAAQPKTNAMDGEVAWGEAVNGWQCRLRAKRSAWKSGETPTLKFDVRNLGPDARMLDIGTLCLEADGTWHEWTGGADFKTAPLSNGAQQADTSITLNDTWHDKATKKPLRLTEGKHTLRVRVAGEPVPPGTGKALVAVSNPVEITIEKGDAP